MTLTMPTGGLRPGRAPELRVDAPTTGDDIARLGDVMTRLGAQIEGQRNDRALRRAQVDMMEGFNALRLEVDGLGDPDQADQHFMAGAQALQQRILGGVPDAVREDAELRFRELQARQGYAVGRHTLALRQSEGRADIARAEAETIRMAAGGDPQLRATAEAGFQSILDNAVRSGVLTPERAEAMRQGWARDADRTRAEAMLDPGAGDPAALIEALDAGQMAGLDPMDAARLRARAERAIAGAEAARALGQRLAAGRRILLAGERLADADALAETARDSGHPDAEAFLAVHELYALQPGLEAMTPDEVERWVVELERDPVPADREDLLQQRRAAREMLQTMREGWARDPVTRGQRLAILPGGDIPAPDQADDATLVEAIRARVAAVQGRLVDGGFVTMPRGLTPREQERWAPPVFNAEERRAWAAAAAPTESPGNRARLARVMFEALGEDALTHSREVADDPVFRHAGSLLAMGVPDRLVQDMFEGQRALAQGDAPLPSETVRRDFFFQNVDGLFDNMAEADTRDEVIAAADALYAARMRGHPDAREPGRREQHYMQALHEVLGGTGQHGSRGAAGGVQEFRGRPTLMPPGVSAVQVHRRLSSLSLQWRRPGGDVDAVMAGVSLNGRPPRLSGAPIDAATLQRVQLWAAGGGGWLMVYQPRVGDLEIVTDDQGEPWQLDIGALMQLRPGGGAP